MEREEAIKQLSEALAVLVPELNESKETNRDEDRENREMYIPKMIDLGLPSGRLWADRNVGAKSPEDDGLYFSWGNVVGHTANDEYNFDEDEYKKTSGAKLRDSYQPGYSDNDAAKRYNLKFDIKSRMPRMVDFAELVEYCDHKWVEQNGVKGMQFTSRVNGNSIFFPASGLRYGVSLYNRGSYGHYWSASLNSQADGYTLLFNSGGVNPANYDYRYNGFSVRAVQ